MTYFEISPARAKKKNPDDLWNDPNWVAEEKLNGWRFLMHFGRDLDRTYFTGRKTSVVTGFHSEKGLCVPSLWPSKPDIGYTVLDGEIVPPHGASFHDLAGIMNTSPEKAQKRIAEIGVPRYRAFDILFCNNIDIRGLCQLERWKKLHTLNVTIPNTMFVSQLWNDKENQYKNIVKAGGEGVILKDILAPYGEGWVKVKRFSTIDVIVTGFKEGKGKYYGQIGALKCSVYDRTGNLVEIAQVSGMTDEIRRNMTEYFDSQWWMTVIEISAQEFGRDRLLHPQFERIRPDADPRSATWAKMMQDLGRADKEVENKSQLRLEGL